MEKGDIIIITLARWDNPYASTAFSLAKALAKDRRVFLFDNPFTWKDYLFRKNEDAIRNRKDALLKGQNMFRKLPDAPEKLTVVTPRLMLPVNWLPPGRGYDFLSARNQRLFAAAIAETCQSFGIRDYILLNIFNPYYGNILPTEHPPAYTVYYTVDDIRHAPYIHKHGPRLEQARMASADMVLATSSQLKADKAASLNREVRLLPNAANVKLFHASMEDELPVPAELAGEDREVLLYMGAIGLRLDYELLAESAKSHADKLFLMIGPKGDNMQNSQFERMSNVKFIGSKTQAELPAYLKYAHCGLIPFVRSPFTRSIYPLKINEYLAAGLPVVSTDFSPDINGFGRLIHLANDADTFIEGIRKALATNSPDEKQNRYLIAAQHSWDHRADQLLGWIAEDMLRRR